MTHPKVLAMAREIAADELGVDAMLKAYLDGTRDDQREVRIAIAAIERVTAMFATHCTEGWIVDVAENFDHLPEPEGGSDE